MSFLCTDKGVNDFLSHCCPNSNNDIKDFDIL